MGSLFFIFEMTCIEKLFSVNCWNKVLVKGLKWIFTTKLFLLLLAGIVHNDCSKSISAHLAKLISPVLTPVNKIIFKAVRIEKDILLASPSKNNQRVLISLIVKCRSRGFSNPPISLERMLAAGFTVISPRLTA